MDTSDSENSDVDAADDDWVADELDAADDDSVVKGKRRMRKIVSKSGSSVGSDPSNTIDIGGLKIDDSGDETVAVSGETPASICCSCSKYSSCKTTKCQCRSAGGFCGASCGCVPTKCANRELDESLQPQGAEGIVNGSASDETKDGLLVSHGAMLLHSALVDKPVETNDDGGTKRKPLSDIGNTVVSCIFAMFGIYLVQYLFSNTFFLLIIINLPYVNL